MNDKDKEAFENSLHVVQNKSNDYQRWQAIWQAACEYKQQKMVEALTSFKISTQIIMLKLLLVFVLCLMVAKGYVMITLERIAGLIKGIPNG